MLIYFLIFISKIIENALSTLRLIVVANGKKIFGAILQGIVALVWIFVTGIIIIDINKEAIKIIISCGCAIVVSYLGSLLEQKIGMGTNMIMCVIKEEYEEDVKEKLEDYKIITLCEKDKNYSILFVLTRRKEIYKISEIVKHMDNNAIIISEKIKTINNIV